MNTFPFVGTRLENYYQLMVFRPFLRQSFQVVYPSQPPYQVLDIIIQHKKINTLKILDSFEMLIIEHVFLKQIFVCDN